MDSQSKTNDSPLRCKSCDHLLSFHFDDGCTCWLLGVRAVPLYRCACVVNVKGYKFPVIVPKGFQTQASTPKNIISNSGPNAPIAQLSTTLNVNPEGALGKLSNKLLNRDMVQWDKYPNPRKVAISTLAQTLLSMLENLDNE